MLLRLLSAFPLIQSESALDANIALILWYLILETRNLFYLLPLTKCLSLSGSARTLPPYFIIISCWIFPWITMLGARHSISSAAVFRWNPHLCFCLCLFSWHWCRQPWEDANTLWNYTSLLEKSQWLKGENFPQASQLESWDIKTQVLPETINLAAMLSQVEDLTVLNSASAAASQATASQPCFTILMP